MVETISADVISGINPVKVSILESEPLDKGKDKKAILTGAVGFRLVSLIERPYSEKYVEYWKTFRSVGLPVVPSLRKSSRDSLLLTDMKADGSEIYGRNLYYVLRDRDYRERPNKSIDSMFVSLVRNENQFTELKRKALDYANLASKNRIHLPFDDPFELLIHPDGTNELIILDLEFARFNQNEERAYEYNADSVNDFIRYLERAALELDGS